MYSQSLLKLKHNLSSLKSIAEDMLKKLSWEEGYELVVVEALEKTHLDWLFLKPGKNFKITNDIDPTKSLISVGWRYTVDLQENPVIFIYYKSDKIISIQNIWPWKIILSSQSVLSFLLPLLYLHLKEWVLTRVMQKIFILLSKWTDYKRRLRQCAYDRSKYVWRKNSSY